jgi:hypothetical protein
VRGETSSPCSQAQGKTNSSFSGAIPTNKATAPDCLEQFPVFVRDWYLSVFLVGSTGNGSNLALLCDSLDETARPSLYPGSDRRSGYSPNNDVFLECSRSAIGKKSRLLDGDSLDNMRFSWTVFLTTQPSGTDVRVSRDGRDWFVHSLPGTLVNAARCAGLCF